MCFLAEFSNADSNHIKRWSFQHLYTFLFNEHFFRWRHSMYLLLRFSSFFFLLLLLTHSKLYSTFKQKYYTIIFIYCGRNFSENWIQYLIYCRWFVKKKKKYQEWWIDRNGLMCVECSSKLFSVQETKSCVSHKFTN